MHLHRRRAFKVQYRKYLDERDSKPWLRGRLSVPGGPEVEVVGLVDSGAAWSVIPEHFAPSLGVDLSDPTTFTHVTEVAIGHHRIQGVCLPDNATLLMRPAHVTGLHVGVPIRAAFVSGQDFALWGRNDFFQHFDVTFHHMKRRYVLEIKSSF